MRLTSRHPFNTQDNPKFLFRSEIRFYQALLIFLVVSLWVMVSVGVIEYFEWYSVFVPGLLIHTGIIFVCVGCTAVIIKSLNFSALFNTLGFKKTEWQYFLIAFALAVIVWSADYWLQLFLFSDNGKLDGLGIQRDIDQFGFISIVLAICFLAPIAEEVLFRGVLLKGLI